jgi:hypothetical protein
MLVSSSPTCPSEHEALEWQTAIEALMLVVEHGGDTMLPRICSSTWGRYYNRPLGAG